jgi:hypothetical protein
MSAPGLLLCRGGFFEAAFERTGGFMEVFFEGGFGLVEEVFDGCHGRVSKGLKRSGERRVVGFNRL